MESWKCRSLRLSMRDVHEESEFPLQKARERFLLGKKKEKLEGEFECRAEKAHLKMTPRLHA